MHSQSYMRDVFYETNLASFDVFIIPSTRSIWVHRITSCLGKKRCYFAIPVEAAAETSEWHRGPSYVDTAENQKQSLPRGTLL